MGKCAEQVHEIENLCEVINDTIGYKLKNNIYWWDERFLEPYVEPEAEKEAEQRPFTPGDRVRVKNTGEVGTFRGYHIFLSAVGVEFDTPVSGRHNFLGNLDTGYEGKDGCCWYYGIDEIELLPPINQCPEPRTLVSSETYTFKGNKTICTIEIDGRTFTGVAKCDPNDEWDEEIGRQWAELRANQKMLAAVEKELRRQ